MSPVVPRRGLGYAPSTVTPSLSPAGAFTPPTPVDIGPAAQEIARQVQEHQQKADDTAIIGADAQLTDLSNKLLYDPQTGALSRRGLDAQAAHDPTIEAWRKGVSDIGMGLSPAQREVFNNRVDARAGEFDRVIMDHVLRETNTATADAASANLDAERSAILHNYTDPDRVAAGIEHQKNILTITGENLGWAPEVTRQKTAEEISRIHTGVLGLLMAKDQDIAAAKYFRAHSNELEPDALLELQKQVDLSSVRGESQRQADLIVGSTATLGGALTEVRKIEDPQVRDATEQRVHRYFEDKATDERFQRDAAFQRAGQVLESTHDTNSVSPADWLQLSVEERLQLAHREDVLRHPKRVTNPDLYFQLMNSAGISEASRQQFQQLDLKQYRDQLSEPDYQRLLRIQLSVRTKVDDQATRDARKAKAAAEKKAVLNDFLRANGIEMPPSVPGAPLRPPGAPQESPNGIGLGLTAPATGPHDAKLPALPAAWLAHARKNPQYADYLRHMGYQIP